MKRLKQFIAIFMMPDGVVMDEYGDYWVHICQSEVSGGYQYPFNYQKMSVNWLGMWRRETAWISKHSPLANYL